MGVLLKREYKVIKITIYQTGHRNNKNKFLQNNLKFEGVRHCKTELFMPYLCITRCPKYQAMQDISSMGHWNMVFWKISSA